MSVFRRIVTFLAPFIAALAALTWLALPARADWVDNNCITFGDYALSSWTKAEAKNYGFVALKEGYHWGGGCWNNNDIDDSRNEVPQQYYPRGEGPDCSGLTFKVWALSNSYGGGGKHHWLMNQFIHGPYAAADYYSAPGIPFFNISNAYAKVMDAFASTSHVGIVWNANTSQGQDVILEAKGESYGVRLLTENYRGQVYAYRGVRRRNWG
jgi:hypothetical protein